MQKREENERQLRDIQKERQFLEQEKKRIQEGSSSKHNIVTQCTTKEIERATVSMLSEENELEVKQRKIQHRINEPVYERAQGIIFIIAMYGADGTALDVENIESTFKQLNFVVYTERDPTAKQIAELVKAATMCQYTYRYKYVCFYFAGHGGRDENGQLFIRGLQLNESNPAILHIEDFIIKPLRCLENYIRLFFFDCCQKTGSGVPFRNNGSPKNPKVHLGELIAYSSSDGQSSFGDRAKGGIWTYYLCKNLKKNLPITEVLSLTADKVKQIRKNSQEPITLCSSEFNKMILKTGGSSQELYKNASSSESEHSSRDSPTSSYESDSEQQPHQPVSTTLVEPVPEVDGTLLKADEHVIISVMRYTRSITDWSVLGLLLGLSETDLHKINSDPVNKHKAIIVTWLNRGSASWATLVGGLRDPLILMNSIANQIAEDHPKENCKKRRNDTIIMLYSFIYA